MEFSYMDIIIKVISTVAGWIVFEFSYVDTIIKAITTVPTWIILIVGWFVGNYFSTKRAEVNKRRDLSTKFLIDAYRTLTIKISGRKPSTERNSEFENLIADIQLFGSEEQVNLVKELVNTVATGSDADLDPLINSLRKSLRKELSLDPVVGNVEWLRDQKEFGLKLRKRKENI